MANQAENNALNLARRDGLVEERTYWRSLSHFTRAGQASIAFYSLWLTRKTGMTTSEIIMGFAWCLSTTTFLRLLDNFATSMYNVKRKQVKNLH